MLSGNNENNDRRILNDEDIIDVHCHLFNAKYASKEFIAVTWNYILGDYPHQKAGIKLDGEKRNIISDLQGVKEFAEWIAKLIKAALSDCDENYAEAVSEFVKSSYGKDHALVIVPLMMDTYFAFDDNAYEEEILSKRRTEAIIEPFVIPAEQRDSFEAHLKEIKSMVTEEMEKLPSMSKRRSISNQEIDSIFEAVSRELMEPPETLRRDSEYDEIELSPGYWKHMQELESLCEKHSDKIFPFLAIDPRRKGIMKLIKIKVKEGNGIFKGIKLYPPLGYLPTHPNLEPVFEYCVEYDIPITVHCSKGGIPNFSSKNYISSWHEDKHWEKFDHLKDKSIYYANPEKWLPVMEKWPALRINFAHFGNLADEENSKWTDTIIEMMEKYPNIYTDISYFTDEKIIPRINDRIKANKILRTRLMFGTDYVMIMLDGGLKGLENYFNNFYKELEDNMMNGNARRFLKL